MLINKLNRNPKMIPKQNNENENQKNQKTGNRKYMYIKRQKNKLPQKF